MIVRLDTRRLQTLDQIQEFLADSRPLDPRPQTRVEAYAFVAETLERFDYPDRGKADKGLLRRFLVKVAGLSRAQVTRLLRQHRTTGAIADRRGPAGGGEPSPAEEPTARLLAGYRQTAGDRGRGQARAFAWPTPQDALVTLVLIQWCLCRQQPASSRSRC